MAAALERQIKRFAKPIYRRSIPIFRDQTNLTASPHLWNEIAASLDASDTLILIASPEAVSSTWVQKELCAWLTRGACNDPRVFMPGAIDPERKRRLLFAVTGGAVVWNDASRDFDWEKTTALPRMLSRVFDGEPLWVDLRWTRGAPGPFDRTNAEFMSAAAKLTAAIRNVPLETLIGLDYREHRRTLRMAFGAAAVFFVLLIAAVIATWFYVRTAGSLTVTNRSLEIRQAEMLTSQGTLAGGMPLTQPLEPADRDLIERTRTELGLPASPAAALDHSQVAMLFYLRALSIYTRLGIQSPETIETLGRLRWRLPRIRDAWPQPEPIDDLSVSADGKLVAVASGGVARVLERTTGRVMSSWEHPTPVVVVRFSPDGRWLATGSGDRFLRVWDIQSGTQILKLELPVREADPLDVQDGMQLRFYESDHSVALLEFSPDGRFLAAAHGNASNTATSRIHIWSCADRVERGSLDVTHPAAAFGFSSNGAFFAAGTVGSEVHLFRTATFRAVAGWRPPRSALLANGEIRAIAFSPDETLVAAGGDDNRVRLWKTADASASQVLSDVSAIVSISFSPDGHLLTSASLDGTLKEWPLRGGGGSDLPRTIALSGNPLRVAYSPRGRYLIAAVDDGSVRAWSEDDRTEILRTASPTGRFAFAPDNAALLVADAGPRVLTLDPDLHGSARFVVAPHDAHSYPLQYYDATEDALLEHDEDVVRWLDSESGAVIAEAPVARLSSGGWSGEDGVFVAPSPPSDDGVSFVRLRNRRVERVTLTPSPSPLSRSMAIDRAGQRVALSASESSIGVWDTASGKRLGTYAFTPHHDSYGYIERPWALALDEHGKRLAMVDRTRRVFVWTTGSATGSPRIFEGKDNWHGVDFVPRTGLLLATDDYRFAVYDVESGSVRCEIPHTPFFERFGVSPFGDRLVVLTGGTKTPLVATVHRLAAPGCPAESHFDLGVEEPVHVATSHEGAVVAISTGKEGPARLHVLDIASGRRLATIPLTASAKPDWIRFSRDDRFIITANRSGFRFWVWRTADVVDDARARVVVAK